MFSLAGNLKCAAKSSVKRNEAMQSIMAPVCVTRALPLRTSNHQTCGSQSGRRMALNILGVASLVNLGLFPALADEGEVSNEKTVFLDVSIDRKPAGRIRIELFGDVPVGSQRFADLSVGIEGVGYRLSKFDSLRENYISNEGVARLSYREGGDSPITGGDSMEELLAELNAGQHSNNAPGMVALVVKDLTEQKIVSRLVATQGKLITVEDALGALPNGTAFTITTSPSPDLDDTNLVVGRVVEGMDVIRSLQVLPTVKDNNSSPFFMVAKTIGDKRADVAEKGFGKPFNRVMVAKGGLE